MFGFKAPNLNPNLLYIYIYIDEFKLNLCNSTKVIHFLNHRFLKNLGGVWFVILNNHF